MSKQLDANKTGWDKRILPSFKSFEHFKEWFDPRYKNAKAEVIYKKLGGEVPKKKKESGS
jgi:hypothetical protein